MIADEKKQQQNLANSVQKDDSDGSNGGSGSGSGTDAPAASRRSASCTGRQKQPKQRVAAPRTSDPCRASGTGATRRRTRKGVGSHEAPDTSSGEKSGFDAVKLPPARLAAQEEISKKSPQPTAVAAGLARIEGKVGNKRAIEEAIMPPPSPRSKHRRTKMAPSRAPVSGGFAA